MTLSIELSPDEVKEIIAKHVGALDEVRQHVEASDVKIDVGMEWSGHGMGEMQHAKFKGVVVKVRK